MRQIVVDTETTGLSVSDGHCVIEFGGVELIDRQRSYNDLHFYFNPKRSIDAGALAVHGITEAFLVDKPVFSEVVEQLLDYLRGAELIIHNAAFDLSFLDAELKRAKSKIKSLTECCQVFDTLVFARKKHAGQRNSLDALCKRYFVDNTNRKLHGALLDAELLAEVYLAMTGGQASLSIESDVVQMSPIEQEVTQISLTELDTALNLIVVEPSTEEKVAHQKFIQAIRLHSAEKA